MTSTCGGARIAGLAVAVVAGGCVARAAPRPAAIEMIPQVGHSADIDDVVLTGDGRFAVSSAGDATVRVWDFSTRHLMRTLVGHEGPVLHIALARGDRSVFSTGQDRSVRRWELATGRQSWRADRPQADGPCVRLAVSHRGGLVACGGEDGRVQLLEAASGRSVRWIGGQAGSVTTLDFSPDDARLLVASDGGGLMVWPVRGGKQETIAPAGWSGQGAWADGGRHVVTTDGMRSLVADPGAKKVIELELGRYDNGAQVLDVSDGGRALWFGRWEETDNLQRWDSTGKMRWRVTVPGGRVRALAVSGDGRYAAVVTQDGALRRYRADGHLDVEIARGDEAVSSIAITPDGKTLLVAHGAAASIGEGVIGAVGGTAFMGGRARRVTAWDVTTARPRASIRDQLPPVSAIAVTPRGDRVAVAPLSAQPQFYDVATLRPGEPIGKAGDEAFALAFSHDGDMLVMGARYGGGVALPLRTGGTPTSLDEMLGMAYAITVSADGKVAAQGGNTTTLILWSTATGKALMRRDVGPSMAGVVRLSADGALVATGHQDGRIRLWDRATGALRHEMRGHGQAVTDLAFAPDGAGLASAGIDGTVRVWRVADGAEVHVLRGHAGAVTTLAWFPDGRRLASGGQDATVKLWDLAGRRAVSLIGDERDWIVWTDDGYFDASPSGTELTAVIDGLRSYGVDQFAFATNRPDVILERLGGNREAIEHYRARHELRLARAGLDASRVAVDFHVPRIDALRVTRRGKQVDVEVTAHDDRADLVRCDVFVNDVPVGDWPASGRRAKVRASLELTAGRNEIEASCTNRAGAESWRAQEVVTYDRPAPGKLYYIGFGVAKYRDPRLALERPDDDVAAIAGALRKVEGFTEVVPMTFVDDQVTPSALTEVKYLLRRTTVDDTVVVFFAGHGMRTADQRAAFYFLPAGADVARIAETGIPLEDIESLLVGIPARRKLLLLDACESGEVDDMVAAGWEARAASKHLRPRGLVYRPTRAALARPRRRFALERDRFIYADLRRRSGAIVFSSSRGVEASWESEDLGNGLFSAALVEAVTSSAADVDQDHHLDRDELRSYVAGRVAELSSDLQHPTIDRDNLSMTLDLPLPGAAAAAAEAASAEPAQPTDQPLPPEDQPREDRDGDGILDAADACPDDPEDFDGFEDPDGCPDPDNDQDGILDVDDLCPNDPEDRDGFEDEDGCPDLDNDKDGILDKDDPTPGP
jgi:WD40 repeat protein